MINFNNIALRRGRNLLFEQMTLTIYAGQKAGITGANGTGKSSLFALLLGEHQADTGEYGLPPAITVSHVRQESPALDTPAIEYVLDGDEELRSVEAALEIHADDGKRTGELFARMEEIDAYTARSRAARLLSGLGFTEDQHEAPVMSFSGGWRMRLNLAQALMCRSDLLLLDEPTNHLDLDAVIWLQDWLRDYQGTLLLISHDRDLLDEICTHIVHIENGRVDLTSGNYTAFEKHRAAKLAGQQAGYLKQQREIEHVKSFVERFRYKASKARQAQSRLKTLERMELIAPAHVDSPFSFKFSDPEKLQSPLIRLDDADAGYGEHKVLRNLKLNLEPGDRTALLGANGAGKSTLVKVLAAELAPLAGKRTPAKDLNIGYFAQHQIEQLDRQQNALEHLQALGPKATERELRGHLGGFGFQGDRVLQQAGTFSGGEKARLVLAMIVYQRPNVLLLDEPTNHLDINMRHALSVALQDFAGAVVLVAHDPHLLRLVVDNFLLVAHGDVAEFDGDLEDYARWLADHRNQPPAGTAGSGGQAIPSAKQRRKANAEARRRLQPLRSDVARLEKDMGKLETERAKVHQQLGDAALYEAEQKEQLTALLQEKSKLERDIGKIEEQWLAATEKLEKATVGAG